MKASEIRQSFVDFFAQRGHRVYPSAPLVPHGDPTLLFTNAGMVPFKNFFLGTEKPPARRAVSAQKCMRVSGKHNDLENVGPSHRHHTFFEMLGNFSFGDYFKEDAIRFGWELVTEVWGVAPGRVWATVFEEDDEAAELWTRVTGVPEERVQRCGAADNFWAMGDTGPCGPCSEIFYDRQPDLPQVSFAEGSESGRYIEIWNLVFMQFERQEDGRMVPLPDPSIDTGAGLERVTTALQDRESNYDTDLFQPLIAGAADLAGVEYGAGAGHDVSLRVIADHLRAVTFLLADGVIPSNEGRGYVLRRILRRAVRHGMSLGFEEPFLHRLLPLVRRVQGDSYPELGGAETASTVTVESEERKFLTTLASGARQVQDAIDRARGAGATVLPGAEVFRFYDTLGLPLEVLREIAEEERFTLDEEGFERELEAQRSRSRAAVGESRRELEGLREAFRGAGLEGETAFEGYRQQRLEDAEVRWLGRLDDGEPRAAERLERGHRGVVVLDRTPFYAEAGGQLGDRGVLNAGAESEARVVDVQRQKGHHFHFVEVDRGSLAVGARVAAVVEGGWRRPTERNHTATHLLHAALRHVLGAAVRQAGSLVAPDRLRFDFTYGQPLTAGELERIEELVNRWILSARPTRITADRDYDEALAAGAMALFGEKYGDTVRTVEVPPLRLEEGDELESLELCGGCHVANTGEIGLFVIVSERAVASGVRRIEARTGEGARAYLEGKRRLVERLSADLGVGEEQLPAEVEALASRRRELERELRRLRLELVSGAAGESDEVLVDGVKVVTREVPPAPASEIRNLADVVRGKLGSGVVVLAARDEERVSLVTAVSKDLTGRVHAGDLARAIAALVDGKGGGRPDFAQAGGRRPGELPRALEAVPGLVREQLEVGAG